MESNNFEEDPHFENSCSSIKPPRNDKRASEAKNIDSHREEQKSNSKYCLNLKNGFLSHQARQRAPPENKIFQ
jgi:hypothetical protein